jgi:hypothetical protein
MTMADVRLPVAMYIGDYKVREIFALDPILEVSAVNSPLCNQASR